MTEPNVLDLPKLSDAAPDPAAVEASLTPPVVESDAAPAMPPNGAVPPDGARPKPKPPPPGSGPKDPRHWSKTKLKGATKADLRKRIELLQEQMPPDPGAAPLSGAVSTPAPTIQPSELIEPLAQTFVTVGEIAAQIWGTHCLLQEREAKTLGAVWAPIAAQHGGALGDAMPWLVACLTTAGIVAPRVRITRAEAAKHKQEPTPEKPEAKPAPAPMAGERIRGPDE